MHTCAPATTAPPGRPARSRPSWALVLTMDLALVLLFAGIGRSAHALEPTGVLHTAWPFLTGLLLGWALWRVHRAPWSLWPHGTGLWLTTVSTGMILRALTGQGTAPSFVVVTLAVLALFLLGPRALLHRTTTPHHAHHRPDRPGKAPSCSPPSS